MAEDNAESRNLEPTERRRQEAREQGKVAVSADLYAGLLLLVGTLVLWWQGPELGTRILRLTRAGLESHAFILDLSFREASALIGELIMEYLGLVGWPLAMLSLSIIAVGLAQTGVLFNPTLLAVKIQRIDPSQGFAKIFSLSSLVKVFFSVLKALLVGFVLYWVIRSRHDDIAQLGEGTVSFAAAKGWSIVIQSALGVAICLTILGVADYAYQRYRLETSLKMTRQELKEELKREEGDPLLRGRIRRMQREISRRRMLREVPKATVIITNPTHFAVALRFQRKTMATPVVLAKGKDLFAKKMIEIARDKGVPIVEKPPLARALFRMCQPGREIPPTLYFAVAEILAWLQKSGAPGILDRETV